MPVVGYSYRPVAYGTHGLVAAAHPFATLAGLDVLRSGGGVVDAAIAVNAVLAVVQPQMCGLGGDLFVLYRDALTGEVSFLNAAGRSGARATPGALRQRGLGALPLTGPLAVSVPGGVAGWGALAARLGTRSLGDLLKPAIALAEDGFPVSDLLAQTIAERRDEIEDPEWHRIYAPDGRGPRAGELLRQPDLARSLARVAEDGADAFYRGELAARIVRHVEAGGGFLTTDDLAGHVARWQAPLCATYRDATVYQTPPPTQGLTLLQALNLVEGFDLAALAPGSADHLHLLVEATKLAYADRDRYLGDPDHVVVPVAGLLDKTYAGHRRVLVRPRRVAPTVLPGDLAGDTTGFVVATSDGSMLAGIQSLYWAFGSGVVPPGTGITLHNRGASFSLDPASPSVLAPGKQPLHTLIASLALRGGTPVAALATMGGHGQPQTHLQVLVNILDFGMDPQEAVERPRVIQGRFRHTDPADRLRVEARVSARTVATLRRRGHHIDVVAERAHVMGHAHALTFRSTPAGAVLAGGADPRGDGLALGY
ncbi:MAG: gamma-glutamyltransferase [Candidatus Rokuibacteriota bacterium]|nr:MAG: gamma-glutamyltransferase [Candidatus Rokubacteria bacterium]